MPVRFGVERRAGWDTHRDWRWSGRRRRRAAAAGRGWARRRRWIRRSEDQLATGLAPEHAKACWKGDEGSPERMQQRARLTTASGGNGGRRTARELLGLREVSAAAQGASGKLRDGGEPENLVGGALETASDGGGARCSAAGDGSSAGRGRVAFIGRRGEGIGSGVRNDPEDKDKLAQRPREGRRRRAGLGRAKLGRGWGRNRQAGPTCRRDRAGNGGRR